MVAHTSVSGSHLPMIKRPGDQGICHGKVTARGDRPDRSATPARSSPEPPDTPPYVAIGPAYPAGPERATRGERALMAITRTALDHDGFRGGIDVRVSLRD